MYLKSGEKITTTKESDSCLTADSQNITCPPSSALLPKIGLGQRKEVQSRCILPAAFLDSDKGCEKRTFKFHLCAVTQTQKGYQPTAKTNSWQGPPSLARAIPASPGRWKSPEALQSHLLSNLINHQGKPKYKRLARKSCREKAVIKKQ